MKKPILNEEVLRMRKMMGLSEDYDIDSHYEDSIMGDLPGETKEPEDDDDDLIEFEIPNWALSALINGDESGLTDEDQEKLNAFVDDVVSKYGNAHFMMGDESETDLGFRHSNDIDNLGNEMEFNSLSSAAEFIGTKSAMSAISVAANKGTLYRKIKWFYINKNKCIQIEVELFDRSSYFLIYSEEILINGIYSIPFVIPSRKYKFYVDDIQIDINKKFSETTSLVTKLGGALAGAFAAGPASAQAKAAPAPCRSSWRWSGSASGPATICRKSSSILTARPFGLTPSTANPIGTRSIKTTNRRSMRPLASSGASSPNFIPTRNSFFRCAIRTRGLNPAKQPFSRPWCTCPSREQRSAISSPNSCPSVIAWPTAHNCKTAPS